MTATLHHPRYRLGRLIATGGMGEVWAATDTLLEREVAVKLLKREYAEDATFRSRFAGEARSAGALQHPHVASVLDYGEISEGQESPVPFLVMELVDGRPLSRLLAAGTPLEPEVAAGLMAQAAEGVAAAHALGVVHRDVKPGNLLVTEHGQVKVTDFGVARAADTVPLTATGHIVGTPHYLSPEQAQGSSATPASDVYSLGIVLYECLAGRKPFVGDSPVATALMQIREPLPPFPESVPRRLQNIVRVATAKDPAARYATAAGFAAALRDESPDTRSFLIPEDEAAAATPPAAVTTSAPAAPPAGAGHRSPRRTPWWALAAAGLLVLLGVGWAVLADIGSQAPEPPPTQAPAETDLVRVRAEAYLGEPATEVARKLRRLGLTVQTSPRENPGRRLAGTVASVTPEGMVERGSRIVLGVWGVAPVVDPAPPETTDGSGPSTGGSTDDPGGNPGSGKGGETGDAQGKGEAGTDGGATGGDAGGADESGGNPGSGKGGGQGSGSGSANDGSKGGGSGGKGKGKG